MSVEAGSRVPGFDGAGSAAGASARPEAELVGEVADVVYGSEHVGLARAALLPFLLEPREPA